VVAHEFSVLKKIADLRRWSTVDSKRSEEVRHMLFGERTRTHSRFATHRTARAAR